MRNRVFDRIIQKTRQSVQFSRQHVLFLASVLVGLSACAPAPPMRSVQRAPANIPQVRVLVHQSLDRVELSCNEAFNLRSADKLIILVQARQTIVLKQVSGQVEVVDWQGNSHGSFDRIVCVPNGVTTRFEVAANRYRGAVEIRIIDRALKCINELDMESYLLGVVKNEIGAVSSPEIEAAKAQAVAARTYAVKYMGKYGQYDFESTVNDQVYKGASSEHENTNFAVLETQGQILTYSDKPIQAFYHSSSGGVTANVEDVWTSSNPVPYLRSVSTRRAGVDYTAESPHHRWKVEWEAHEIEELIKHNLPGVLAKAYDPEIFARLGNQSLHNLLILERDESFRIRRFRIGFESDSFDVNGEQLRRILRGKKYILYSSLFTLQIDRKPGGIIKKVTAIGTGFGHGVGMCQYSALAMAREGLNYDQILRFFYRGSVVRADYGKSAL